MSRGIVTAERSVYWGHGGITLIRRGIRGRDDLFQISFPCGPQGPVDMPRAPWLAICAAWLDAGTLPEGARPILTGHSRWTGSQWVNCDCGAHYVQDCCARGEDESALVASDVRAEGVS